MTYKTNYSSGQIIALTLLQVIIGWLFLYEGLVKLFTPDWSVSSYLSGATVFFTLFFKSITLNENLLRQVDLICELGLVTIGLGLFVGLFSKLGKIVGIILLVFYHFVYCPSASLGINSQVEGSYWQVNKNRIEIETILILLYFPSSQITGINRYLLKFSNSKN